MLSYRKSNAGFAVLRHNRRASQRRALFGIAGARRLLGTLADTMIEQKNNPKPKVTLRTKVVIVLVFLAVGLGGLYFGSPLQRFRSSEENACYEKCAKLQRSWRMVSSYPPGTIVQRRYDGPWKCECY